MRENKRQTATEGQFTKVLTTDWYAKLSKVSKTIKVQEIVTNKRRRKDVQQLNAIMVS